MFWSVGVTRDPVETVADATMVVLPSKVRLTNSAHACSGAIDRAAGLWPSVANEARTITAHTSVALSNAMTSRLILGAPHQEVDEVAMTHLTVR